MKKRLLGVIVGALLGSAGGVAHGSGFAIIEQSVSGLGNAFAGGSAAAEDAATVFFNPAGMTRLSGARMEAAVHVVVPQAEFHSQGSTTVTGAVLTGGDGGDAGGAAAIPNFYYVRQLDERWWVGLGVNSPFALSTEYDRDWVGRYYAVDSEVKTVNLNPSLAYKLNDRLSLGAGIDLQWVEATLSNAIDYGSICTTQVPVFLRGAVCPGAAPQAADGFAEVKGDDWAFGYNAGLLYQLSDATRIGLAYRSQIHYVLDGNADFSQPANVTPLATSLNYVDTGVNAELTTPPSLSLSFYHDVNERWAVMGDATWTKWSNLDEIRIVFDSGAVDAVTTTAWEDSMRYSLGLTYNPDARWTYRAGVAYDETPIPDAAHRTPRIPGEDRTWLAFGLGYQISDKLGVDVGYTHLFVPDPVITRNLAALPTVTEDTYHGNLNGSYDAAVDILSMQLSYRFD